MIYDMWFILQFSLYLVELSKDIASNKWIEKNNESNWAVYTYTDNKVTMLK